MKKVFILTFYIFVLSNPFVIHAAPLTPTPNLTSTSSNSITNEVNYLKEQLNEYRNENYQNAIRTADQAGRKADNFISIVMIIATLFGITLAVVSFVIGGTLKVMIQQLNFHVQRAKKFSQVIENISNEAVKKGKELSNLSDQMQSAKIELKNTISSSKENSQKVKDIEQKIESLTEKTEQTISQINTLSGTATMISASSVYPNQVSFNPYNNLTSAKSVDGSLLDLSYLHPSDPCKCSKCGEIIQNKNPLTCGQALTMEINSGLCEKCSKE